MSQSQSRLRVGRVLAFGLLAEVATVVLIVLVLTFHARVLAVGQPQQTIDAFDQRAASILGPGGGVLFTFIAALLATAPLRQRVVTHGVLVGVVTMLLTIPGLLSSVPAMRPLYMMAMVFKVIAGLGAGELARRRQLRGATR